MYFNRSRRQWCVIAIVVGLFTTLSALILGAVFHTEGGGANIGAGMVFNIGLMMFLSGVILFIIDWAVRRSERRL
jgi:hypothetical protein